MAKTGMSTRGQKRVLTNTARKRNQQNIQVRVKIGVQFERWKELKDTLKLKNHEELRTFYWTSEY